jgi:HD superfamily phosphodiesterase
MNFTELSNYINHNYSAKLYQYLKELFSENPLPSDDQEHHLRVWKYAERICYELAKTNIKVKEDDLEALIIACFFHDAGLSTSHGEDHGREGKILCEKFLDSNKISTARRFDILEAVHNHDDKRYPTIKNITLGKKLNILSVLSIADDLDAFGIIGVYRYSEIYLLRSIHMEDLGLKVIANLSGRFNHFMSNCSSFPELVKEHAPRYSETEKFFRNYNLQLRRIEEGEANHESGPVGIVKHIFRQVIMSPSSMDEICENIYSSTEDPVITTFFRRLQNEIAIYTLN